MINENNNDGVSNKNKIWFCIFAKIFVNPFPKSLFHGPDSIFLLLKICIRSASDSYQNNRRFDIITSVVCL